MKLIYLDHAATSFPKSDGVFQAMQTAFYGCGNGGRSGHPLSIAGAETIYNCREALSLLFGTESERVVLCSGATAALNMALKGLTVKGMTVLCSAMEHNAVLRPLYALSDAGRIKLKFFTPSFTNENKTAEAVFNALDGVGLLAVSHGANTCGICLPLKRLCAEAKRAGVITVIDCAQTAGHIPIDIKDLGADVICLAGHKGLGGPMGTGALLVNPQSTLRFETIIEGGTGVASRERAMPPMLPERLEAGTANLTGIAGLTAACKELVLEPAREEALRLRAVEGLRRINGVKVYGCDCLGQYVPVVLFNLRGKSADEVAASLADCGLCVRGGLHCAPIAHGVLGTGKYGAVRASFGKSNTEDDVDALLAAVAHLAV